MAIAQKILKAQEGASFIRKMFTKGTELKEKFGEDNVFDFSLGNPDLKPPQDFNDVLLEIAEMDIPKKHSYMANVGFDSTREVVAKRVAEDQVVDVTKEDIVMTCGAGGALNVVLKSILNPGDEVLASTPCFMEYKFYVDNHGGVFKTIDGLSNFDIDLEKMEAEINEKTAAVIINSPNNPSGHIYSGSMIRDLSVMLRKKSLEIGRAIYLISDEPYRKIVFDNNVVPSIFDKYDSSIIVTSYSKELSIPGERIGYIAVNKKADDYDNLMGALSLCNRILGFVNAPSIMQRVIAELYGVEVDISVYQNKRDILVDGLKKIGYEFEVPKGTFYLFVKVPNGNSDDEFIEKLLKENILVVPGAGFSFPGYFRISYCVPESTIENSISGFERAFNS